MPPPRLARSRAAWVLMALLVRILANQAALAGHWGRAVGSSRDVG